MLLIISSYHNIACSWCIGSLSHDFTVTNDKAVGLVTAQKEVIYFAERQPKIV